MPQDFDATVFVGRTVDQLCFTLNQIALHFDGDIHITIEGPYSHQRSSTAPEAEILDAPNMKTDLRELLGSTVVRAAALEGGTLLLVFENGHQLKCFDLPQYESYHIKQGNREIIV